MVVVQSLLLIADSHATPDGQRDNWHWLGVAITLAQAIGLNHDSTHLEHISEGTKRLRKRLWWSCFIYDRLIALGLRYPTRIKDEDFSVPMLVPGDFDGAYTVPTDEVVFSNRVHMTRDEDAAVDLTAICIARATLCVYIGRIMRVQYSVLSPGTEACNTSTRAPMVAPRYEMGDIKGVGSLYMSLCDWAQNLPPSCRHRPPRLSTVEDKDHAVYLQRTLIQMEYHTAVSVLYKPWFSPPVNATTKLCPVTLSLSRIRVRFSASQVTRLLSDLSRVGLERFLPTTGISTILSATIVHLASVKAPSQQAYGDAVRDFRLCIGALDRLRDVHADAGHACRYLSVAFNRIHRLPRYGQTILPTNCYQQATAKAGNGPFVADTSCASPLSLLLDSN